MHFPPCTGPSRSLVAWSDWHAGLTAGSRGEVSGEQGSPAADARAQGPEQVRVWGRRHRGGQDRKTGAVGAELCAAGRCQRRQVGARRQRLQLPPCSSAPGFRTDHMSTNNHRSPQLAQQPAAVSAVSKACLQGRAMPSNATAVGRAAAELLSSKSKIALQLMWHETRGAGLLDVERFDGTTLIAALWPVRNWSCSLSFSTWGQQAGSRPQRGAQRPHHAQL